MTFRDKEGREIGLWEFERLINNAHYRLLIAHQSNGSIIRTEWMGISPDGSDCIFRSLIQGGNLNGSEIWTDTIEEARKQHELFVHMVETDRRVNRIEAFAVVSGVVLLLLLIFVFVLGR